MDQLWQLWLQVLRKYLQLYLGSLEFFFVEEVWIRGQTLIQKRQEARANRDFATAN